MIIIGSVNLQAAQPSSSMIGSDKTKIYRLSHSDALAVGTANKQAIGGLCKNISVEEKGGE